MTPDEHEAHDALPALIARVRELEAQVEEYRLGDIQMGKQWNGLQDLVSSLEAENAQLMAANHAFGALMTPITTLNQQEPQP